MNIVTYDTKYGKISLYENELYIGQVFKRGEYWEEDMLLKLKNIINPNRNILEIGGHCGTSTIFYAKLLNEGKKIYVFEPQKRLCDLLLKNVRDNGLEDKVVVYNKGLFCYQGKGKMNNIDMDGKQKEVMKCYENGEYCNFGGITLGKDGEEIELDYIDNLGLKDIGFIHSDCQGSERHIFSKGQELIKRDRPIIYYEDNYKFDKNLYNQVCVKYPEYQENGNFEIINLCQSLRYIYLEKIDGMTSNLLISIN